VLLLFCLPLKRKHEVEQMSVSSINCILNESLPFLILTKTTEIENRKNIIDLIEIGNIRLHQQLFID
jgi:hypothetical protein